MSSAETIDAGIPPPLSNRAGYDWRYFLLILICGIALGDWLNLRTERLYLDDESEQAGNVSQHFNIQGHTVVPQIKSHDNALFVFPVNFRVPHKLVFKLKPQGTASYEIYLRQGSSRRLITSGTISNSQSRSIWLPRATGTLEFVGHGALSWMDLRLVRQVFLWPFYLVTFIALGILVLKSPRRNVRGAEWLVLVASTLLTLGAIELLLRSSALKLPAVIVAARHDLGLVGSDTRLIDPKRYRLRHTPNIDAPCEWRYGGIVNYGVIPKSASRGQLHRYPFHTDAEGFRNAAVRGKIDIAALGDSFTDAASLPVEESWPAQLEKQTGLIVQNYGTSGFGPQQELYALRDFALRHKPRWTVLAFFGGNDLEDAELFDQWEHTADRSGEEPTGWKLTPSFRRYETLYLWTIASVALELIKGHDESGPNELYDHTPSEPRFDQGLFTIPVADRAIQLAFWPAHLQKMSVTRTEIAESPGWKITQSVLRQMKTDCAEAGSRFVLMYIPTKAQVHWPLLERSISKEKLQEAIAFYDRPKQAALSIDAIGANRLALNSLLQEFCAHENIPMLDLTAAEQREAESGQEVYFPDDPHWNGNGQAVAARELAKFLGLP